eukprot:TRINITY_DN1113_c0_g1_i1.p2 TRINITY_DN1113_c0_g1~~TRINITY_DN1113_c0_g1_i1.p2  ORF type:complete len:751 (-),score=248.89 TRINITY_DN1113_c0_g1_i1:2611-4863(-)
MQGITPHDLATRLNATTVVEILDAHANSELQKSATGNIHKRAEPQQQQQGLDNMKSQLRSTIKLQKHISKKGLSSEVKSSGSRGPPSRPPPPKPVENAVAPVSSPALPVGIAEPSTTKAPPRAATQPASLPNLAPTTTSTPSPKQTGSAIRGGAAPVPFKLPPVQQRQSSGPMQPVRVPPQQAPPQPSIQPIKQQPSAQPAKQMQQQPSVAKQGPPKQAPPQPVPLANTTQQSSQSQLGRPTRSPSKSHENRTVLNTLRSQAAYIPSALVDLLGSEDVSQEKNEKDFFLDGQKVKVQDPIAQPAGVSDIAPKVFKGAIQIWKPIFIVQIPFKVKEAKEVEKIRKMFETEVRTMTQAGVLHPHLISYLGCEVVCKEALSGFVNVVTESTGEGSSNMKELLEKEKTFSEKFAANVLARTLEALAFLHKRKIVHRAIQLENILIDSTGKLKLTDYLASTKILMLETQQKKAQEDGDSWAEPVTSPYHTAPEALKDYSFTTYSDVWSIGACLLEMVTGKTAFWEYEGVGAALEAMECEEPPISKETLATFSNECKEFILPCFSCLPTERPPVRNLLASKFIASNTISDEDIYSIMNTLKENNEDRISEQEIRANQKQLDEGLKWLAGALDSGNNKQATRFSSYVEELVKKIEANPKLKGVESLRFLVQYANQLITRHKDATAAKSSGMNSAPATLQHAKRPSSTSLASSFASEQAVYDEDEDEEDDDHDVDDDGDDDDNDNDEDDEDDLDIQWD